MASCSQIEKRTSLNVFRNRLHQRATSKIEDANLLLAELTLPSLKVFRCPGIAVSKYSRLGRRTFFKVFAFCMQRRAASKVSNFLQSDRFVCN